MKRLIAFLVVACLVPAAVYAATDYLTKYGASLSEDAVAAARAATVPSQLSREEHEIFRLGYAYGYDAGQNTVGTRTGYLADAPTYIVNLSSRKFHRPECYMVNAILLENREDLYCTYDEAIARGFAPCGKCLGSAGN